MNQLPSTEKMYQALLQKDSQFEGIFFAGIKTTGIFCRPTCRARKPKKENVEYFHTAKDAIAYGYRPCKICQPMSKAGETPDWILSILENIESSVDGKMKDYELVQKGLDPSRVRRWFKKEHGVTFQAYLRSLRINRAFGTLRTNTTVTETAYATGFESLSGFQDAFKKNTGFKPSDSTNQNIVSVSRILTPLGPMIAGVSKNGLCLLEFTDRKMLETQIGRITSRTKTKFISGEDPLFLQLQSEINEYFNGKRTKFEIPLDLVGTDFQVHVWEILLKIPFGFTRSYSDQAKAIGNPKATRAVAKANGDNAISILVPCHRVIGLDGNLVGYGGGLHRKKYLLDLERSSLNKDSSADHER